MLVEKEDKKRGRNKSYNYVRNYCRIMSNI
ncbi:MAG: hypothetical protein Ta2C_03060 [Candidatus Endomicrobiellum trichonymphae]|nr:MAG: hypothetical protein Ta2C_03060 [Candidatus Endomicrobium trichonymphae]